MYTMTLEWEFVEKYALTSTILQEKNRSLMFNLDLSFQFVPVDSLLMMRLSRCRTKFFFS